jgi:DNA polymerase-3 subunit alpha
MGIKVLPPDVNDSDSDYTPRGTDIRFGLSAIRNVGGNVVDGSIVAPARARAASATSTTSSRRSIASSCNKRVVESLIKAGAFDSLGHAGAG